MLVTKETRVVNGVDQTNYNIIFWNYLAYIALGIYILFYTVTRGNIFGTGAFVIIPCILFARLSKQKGVIMGFLALPLNIVLKVIYDNIDILNSIRSVIFPWVAVFVATYIVSDNTELRQAKEDLLLSLVEKEQKINKLEELIPICSYCKEVRDPKGYWNKLEDYILENTESNFTHGVCDSCKEKVLAQDDLNTTRI